MNTTLNHIPSGRMEAGAANPDHIDALLAKHPFLEGLSPHQIQLLKDCAMVVNYQPGELIFREGDPANRFYLLHRGKVALESCGENQGIARIDVIGAGDVLGWSWLFPPYHWHFDARVLEPTEALFFYATPLREECENDHDLGYELSQRMSRIMLQRLQATRKRLRNFGPCPCKHG